MSEQRRCPKCDAEIPAISPIGLCPRCLLAAANDSQSKNREGEAPAEPGSTKLNPPASGFVPPTVEALAPLFPQLEILELLGKGGMGAVYKARQPGLDRLIALKILPSEISHDPAFAERFQREARALARLSHPHIVAVYDFGHAIQTLPHPLLGEVRTRLEDLYFIVMEFVDGANLRQAIQTKKLSPAEALAIVPQICEALQFAHDEGIVHRDIKPENILIDKRGRVKIADFGLVKLLGQDANDHSLTATHQVVGTLRYMAPEQMQGSREVDHRADIYSLGVVFYELLTGELPMGRFAPPSKRVQVDVRLDDVVLRALEQDPVQRYQHVSEVKTDVDAIARSPSVAHPNVTKGVSAQPVVKTLETWWFGNKANSRKLMKGVLLFVAIVCLGSLVNIGGKFESGGTTTIRIGFGDSWFRYNTVGGSHVDLLSWSFGIGALGVFLLVAWFRVRCAEGRHAENLARPELASDALERTGPGFVLPDVGPPVTQTRFAVADSCDVGRQAIFHFSSLGYRLIEQRSEVCVFQRGRKWGGFWDTDLRYYYTILTVRTAPAAAGTQWVSCDWSVRTAGAWIMQRDIRQLEAEGRGLESLLGGGVAGGTNSSDTAATASVSLPGPHLVQAPADCLLLSAAVAFVTAFGVVLWLLVSPTRTLVSPMIRENLIIASVRLATYSLLIGVAGLMLRQLRARLVVLLLVVIAGLFLPVVIASKVAMEFRHMLEWPVEIPVWLGIPAALWATIRLFRGDVRRAFDASAEQRKSRDVSQSPQETPSATNGRVASTPEFVPNSTLARVWHEWWSERDRWFTRVVQTALVLLHFVCLAMFISWGFSFRDVEGRCVTSTRIGFPSPWFTYATNPEPNTPFRFHINLLSSSLFIATVGLVAYLVYWRIEKTKSDSKLGFWGSPKGVLIFWVTFAVTGAGMLNSWMIQELQSFVPSLGTIESGIGAEFQVPAGQVAVLEIVTLRDGKIAPLPSLCGYVIAPNDRRFAATFRWFRNVGPPPSNSDYECWNLEIRTAGGGGGSVNGLIEPPSLSTFVGSMSMNMGDLTPNEEVILWSGNANELPDKGLFGGLVGLRVTVTGYGFETTGGSGIGHIDWKRELTSSPISRRKLSNTAP